MKRTVTLYGISVILIGMILLACGSSKNVQQSAIVQSIPWQRDSFVANGDDADWVSALTPLDEKLGISYGVSNDKDNLYIRLSSQNEITIQRILRGGLTVYINNHGVKEEAGAAGISFPTGNRVQKGDKLLNDRPELQQNKHVALDAVQDYSLFGFRDIKTPENFDYGKPNPAGIELGIGFNNAGAVVYEATVPLAAFLAEADLRNPGRKSFALGFVLDPVPGQGGSRGGGGLSIGGGLGFGSFGSGGGVGLSIGTGSLGRIGGGGKQGKSTHIWRELLLAKQSAQVK